MPLPSANWEQGLAGHPLQKQWAESRNLRSVNDPKAHHRESPFDNPTILSSSCQNSSAHKCKGSECSPSHYKNRMDNAKYSGYRPNNTGICSMILNTVLSCEYLKVYYKLLCCWVAVSKLIFFLVDRTPFHVRNQDSDLQRACTNEILS